MHVLVERGVSGSVGEYRCPSCLSVRLFVCVEWPQYGCIRILLSAKAEQRNDSIHGNKGKHREKMMLVTVVTFLIMLEMNMDV